MAPTYHSFDSNAVGFLTFDALDNAYNNMSGVTFARNMLPSTASTSTIFRRILPSQALGLC